MAAPRALSAAELLGTWERGCDAAPPERALALLRAAVPDEPLDALPSLTVGERNGRLFALRERLFGADIPATADCPACDTAVELVVPAGQLGTGAEPGAAPFELERVAGDDYEVSFRLPTMADLAELPRAAGADALGAALLERCVVEARVGGEPAAAARLPPAVVDALERRMDELDPRADVRLALRCPECGHEWLAGFAIADFLWADLDRWARGILSEVHLLAGAYGWREADILAMSAARREWYLELIGP